VYSQLDYDILRAQTQIRTVGTKQIKKRCRDSYLGGCGYYGGRRRKVRHNVIVYRNQMIIITAIGWQHHGTGETVGTSKKSYCDHRDSCLS
jgi:hypothetical protein